LTGAIVCAAAVRMDYFMPAWQFSVVCSLVHVVTIPTAQNTVLEEWHNDNVFLENNSTYEGLLGFCTGSCPTEVAAPRVCRAPRQRFAKQGAALKATDPRQWHADTVS
jgi:hypothetical protein